MTLDDGNRLWYRDAVFYEVHVKAFYDSNGDGIGDFRGLTMKLDYLSWLGIDAVWLLPFYRSPMRDDGYDVSDYYSIQPEYGTLEDFDEFVEQAHRRKIRVIADLVLNHVSDQHPWFQEARDPNSPRHSWFVWSDTDKKYSQTRVIFSDTEKSNWTWDPVAKQYYWHRFYSHQPDLNYDNPEVREEIKNVVRFWLKRGLDGFRVDAAPYLFEREGTSCEGLPETHAFFKELRAMIDREFPGAILIAEANAPPAEAKQYFGNGNDEFHMVFNFPLMPRMYVALAKEDRAPIVDIVNQIVPIPENCDWATFLRNHDELTLEKVTEEEREIMYREYVKHPKMRFNVGIRRRLAPLMEDDQAAIRLLYALLFSLPGTPFLYYGDEIGMGDNIYLGDRNGVRTPMQWSPDRNAGFSKCDPEQLYAPVITNPIYHYESRNVETQMRLGHSLLNWLRELIRVRKKYSDVLGRGEIRFLNTPNAKVLAYIRSYRHKSVLCVNNLSKKPTAVELDLRGFEGWVPIELQTGVAFPEIREKPYFFTLSPHSFFWFKLRPPQGEEW